MRHAIVLRAGIIVMMLSVFAGVSGKDKAAVVDSLFRRVQAEGYRVDVDRVTTASVPNTDRFTPRGFVEVNDTVAKGQLPFFGKAYSLPYGDTSGINFDGKAEGYTVARKKKEVEVRFTVRNKNESYQFFIQLYPGGKAFVRMNSNQRESVSYSGDYVFFNDRTEK